MNHVHDVIWTELKETLPRVEKSCRYCVVHTMYFVLVKRIYMLTITLVFYSYVMHYHRFCGLKQHVFLISQSWWFRCLGFG